LPDVRRHGATRKPERDRWERSGRWGANAVLVLLALGVGLLVTEGALRLTHYY
jgi:hypothetical protein